MSIEITAPLKVDMAAYHASERERTRVADLMDMVPLGLESALDIGARDGHITLQLSTRIGHVTALDLECPAISDPRITCIAGDAAQLPLPDRSVDLVFCAEVLEHIPSPALERAAKEIMRVSKEHVIVGVPFKQDIRVGRSTCLRCGQISPPWGHVNRFDEERLTTLFSGFQVAARRFVGQTDHGTNAVAAKLMDWAGNPYGSYAQDETCLHCRQALLPPPPRSLLQRALTRLSTRCRDFERLANKQPHANWIHLHLTRP